ncbi:MAG TPA: hypothetical protein VIP51_04000, partial [Eoetvoesiella sp.]
EVQSSMRCCPPQAGQVVTITGITGHDAGLSGHDAGIGGHDRPEYPLACLAVVFAAKNSSITFTLEYDAS